MHKWYLLACKPKEEKRAQQNLLQQEIVSFLPLIPSQKTLRGGKTQVVEIPLFPGYLFAFIDDIDASYRYVRNTRGVRDFVRFGNHLAQMDDGQIQGLMEILRQNQQQAETQVQRFSAGDKVIITDGPFKWLEAVFAASDGDERSMLLINILGSQQQISIANSDYNQA